MLSENGALRQLFLNYCFVTGDVATLAKNPLLEVTYQL